jgi:hypothetical protein
VLLAFVAIAAAGLATRLFPALGHVPPREPARLAWPLTYWNAMGVCCALGAVLSVHAATGREEPAWVRVLATAALPLLTVAGYFTFSRGAIAVAIVGLVAYAALALPRRLPFALLTGGVATVVALRAGYGAGALAGARYFTGEGPDEGAHVALVVALACVLAGVARALLLPLEARLDRVAMPARARRPLIAAVTAALVGLILVAGVALDAPERVRAELRTFTQATFVAQTADYRERLGDASNNGRINIWRADLDAFRAAPVHGVGAGLFRTVWERVRPYRLQAVDGHSLYLETLAELGVIGLAALVTMLGAIAVGAARGLRGQDGHARAALVAAGGALLLHAAIDWDWEMPVLFAGLLGACGIAVARPATAPPRAAPGRLTRILSALAVLLVALTPALLWRSQASLARSTAAFDRGDCRTAVDAALDSLGFMSVRPEPFEVLAYCDLRGGQAVLGMGAMEQARARDPHNWRYAYGLALARALARRDPRPAIAEARRLNPRDPQAAALATAVRGDRPARWRRAAARARLPEG